MKRMIYVALMALGSVAVAQQQASAWSKFNFGIGLNVGWEGGNNSFLFGAIKGGPAPGHQGYDGGFGGPGYGGPGGGFGGGHAALPGGMPGGMPGGYAGGFPMNGLPMNGLPMPMPTGFAGQGPMADQNSATMPYAPVSIQQPRLMPEVKMPRAETQPVGYFTYPQPTYDFFSYQPMWYGY